MKKIFPTLSLVILALTATCAAAKDEYYSYYDQHGQYERSGFYLSVGAGIASSTMEAEYDGSTYETTIDNNTGTQVAIKIGASIRQNVQIYAGRIATIGTTDNDYDYVTGLFGVGVNLFAKDSDLFAEGMLGVSDLTILVDDYDDFSADPGIGISLGLGYQVAKYMEITGRFMFYTLSDPDDDADLNVKQFALTMSFCLY